MSHSTKPLLTCQKVVSAPHPFLSSSHLSTGLTTRVALSAWTVVPSGTLTSFPQSKDAVSRLTTTLRSPLMLLPAVSRAREIGRIETMPSLTTSLSETSRATTLAPRISTNSSRPTLISTSDTSSTHPLLFLAVCQLSTLTMRLSLGLARPRVDSMARML